MVCYDCLNFELISIKFKGKTCSRRRFYFFVFFFHLKDESILFSDIFFLKLCANLIHGSIKIIDIMNFFSSSVHVCCFRNLLLEI